MARRRLVVVGNGMAGARAIEHVIARGGERFDITVFGEELHGNYNRIMLSGLLSGTKSADDILINAPSWYAENGVRFEAGQRVVAIDRSAKTVTSDRGVIEPYDILLIATGSRAAMPPLAGLSGPDGRPKQGIFVYRTLDDCLAIAAAARQARIAATIGGGLLGLEAARALGALGLTSHVVHMASHLLNMQLDAAGGAMLRQALEGFGLTVHTDTLTTAVLGQDRVEGLAFKDGSDLACDLVVVAAGVRPNSEIGREAGLTVERAIVVNDHMQTVDDRSIYAVGECAQHRGQVYGLVAPVWDQARVFADHVTGHNERARYLGTKPATKLKVSGIDLASMGRVDPLDERDEVIQFAEPKRGTYKKLIVRDGRLVGGILMGDVSKAAYLLQAYDRDTPLPEERLALLFDVGVPPAPVSLAELAPETQICACNGVSKGAIGECVRAGAADLAGVMATTRAGTGCGSCRGQVEALVALFGAERAAEPPGREDALLQGEMRADGTLSIAPEAPDGHCTPTQLLRIAEAAIRCGVASVRLAGPDRIDLLGIPPDALPALRRDLQLSDARR